MADKTNQLIAIILAILLPPLGLLVKGVDSKTLIINILLTILFFVPGVIHALYVIVKK